MHPLRDGIQDALFSSPHLPTPAQTQRLHQLLRANALPSDQSRRDLESVISSAAGELARYRDDILHIKVAIDLLASMLIAQTEAHTILEEYSARCTSVFAPIRRLPRELLQDIFALCAPTPPRFFEGYPSFATDVNLDRIAQSHLLRLSRVCSSWHTTAMETPSLWTSVEVDLPLTEIGPYTLKALTRVLSRSLERSAGCPLSIHIRAKHASPLLDLLAQHSERWRTVDVFICHRSVAALSAVKGRLPLLERLQLGGCTSLRDRLDIFEKAPRLSQAVFSKFGTAPRKLPWGQLQRVTYTNVYAPMPLNHGFAAMADCASECEWRIDNLHTSDLRLPLPVLRPISAGITRFSLQLLDRRDGALSGEILGAILRSLTLPRLSHLALESLHRRGGRPIHWPHAAFASFASASSLGTTLHSFSLLGVRITPPDLVDCLSSLPALTRLTLSDIPANAAGAIPSAHLVVTDALLQALTGHNITPHLARVTLHTLRDGFRPSSLLAFVESRIPLPNIHPPEPFRVELRNLDNEGLELDVGVIGRMRELMAQGRLDFEVLSEV
ncbi:hypothetical protein C8R46DRAFT_1139793 [Mycena filopes]|nr:hypothetical protein C8R46DRAFT_1139793 [Mycena filopes]